MTHRIGLFLTLLSVAICLVHSCTDEGLKPKAASSVPEQKPSFIGSSSCASCHQDAYRDWLKSDHYLAMQTVNDSSVLGDFNQATLFADGVSSRFFKKENAYFIHTEGPDGKSQDYQLRYTFGYYPLQQYLVEFEKGQVQATRQSWNSRDKTWFQQYPGQRIPPHDWLHWTGNSQNWNTMCASCHSTNFQKNYNFEEDSYASRFSEINVACESCHGGGSQHISYVNSDAYKRGEKTPGSKLYYGKAADNRLQVNTCAPCHARKTDISPEPLNSTELLDQMIPELISNEHYFADGQIKDEDYEYGSFAQSKMFHNKVKCSDCHNPHSGKLRKEGNAMCLSCHEPRYDSQAHHFHTGNNKSTECISCHMPEKTYMGNDHRRDHSFRIPRPDQSVLYQTPNTCNGCHSKQTAKWAAETINTWYGQKRAYHFSDDLLPGSKLNTQSKVHLYRLTADTTQPEIARATAVYYLSYLQDQETCERLLQLSRDKRAMVRYHAFRALENYPAEWWSQEATHGLSDQVRGVRIATADLYHRVGKEQVPTSARRLYAQADAENKTYLRYQRDFAVGNVMMGDYYLQETDYENAVRHYLRGLKKDSLMNYARLNLSAAYNGLKQNKEALNTLKQAERVDPKNSDIQQNLALLYYELGDPTSSLKHFKQALAAGHSGPDVFYNYGLLLQQNGSEKEAEQILLKGHQAYPTSGKLNYALTYLYLNQQNFTQARKFANYLLQTEAQNASYHPLFRQLGLMK